MSDMPPKGSLPYGWQVKVSKRYPDRVYYFNINTGASSWECPELEHPKEINKEVVKDVSSVSKNVSQDASKSERSLQILEDHPLEPVVSQCPDNKKRRNSADPLPKKRPKESLVINSSGESSKSSIPPTAVVTPVVQHKKLSRISPSSVQSSQISTSENLGIEKCDYERKINFKRVKNGDKVMNISVLKKKKKVSPLNRSDSGRKKSAQGKKVEKPVSSVSSSSGATSSETSEKVLTESSSSSEDNRDVQDVEMVDVSMELLDDLTAKKETIFDTFASYYIILDTNVLISELHLINEIKDTPLDGCGPPHIFIPWIVIEELDKLKSNRSAKSVPIRAVSEAIRYLNSVLGSKHPRFHGQSPAEAEQWAKSYSKCNDDKILECCTALSDKMPKEKVLLLTNDKNLVNKALICKINVHNWETLMKHVKPDITFNITKMKKNKKDVEKDSTKSNISEDVIMEKRLQGQRDSYKREIHAIMSNARQLIKNTLSKFLEKEMFEAYAELWLTFPIKRDLLEGILAGIIKYWCVFSAFMTQKDKRNFELLLEKASRPEGFFGDKEECLVILSTMEEVFSQMKKRRSEIDVPLSCMQDFRVACVDAFDKYCDIDNAIQAVEQRDTLALFERNWVAINQLSCIILDYFKIPHDFQYEKPDVLPREIEIRQLIVYMVPSVERLKTLMFMMLEAVRNCSPSRVIIRKLAGALLNFIPDLGVPYEPVSFPHFTQRALERFFTNPQNREMVEIGYKQIQKFYSKLEEAVTVFLTPKSKNIPTSPETMICD